VFSFVRDDHELAVFDSYKQTGVIIKGGCDLVLRFGFPQVRLDQTWERWTNVEPLAADGTRVKCRGERGMKFIAVVLTDFAGSLQKTTRT